jgi:hypothetical protein
MQNDNLYHFALLWQARLLDEAATRRTLRTVRGEPPPRRGLARLFRNWRERTGTAGRPAIETPLPSASSPMP